MFQVLHIVYAFTIKFPVTFVNYRKKYAFFLTMNECILHLSSLPAMYFMLIILIPLVHARKLSRNSFSKSIILTTLISLNVPIHVFSSFLLVKFVKKPSYDKYKAKSVKRYHSKDF